MVFKSQTEYKIVLKTRFDQETGEIVTDDNGDKLTGNIVDCYSLEDCSKTVLNYISKYGIGKRQWNGGQVYHLGKYIGRIWIDGKFYKPDTEKGKLPKLQEQIDEANEIKKDKINQAKKKAGRMVMSGGS